MDEKNLRTQLFELLPRAVQQRVLFSKVEFDARRLAGVELRLPQSLAEYDAASRLLFDSYLDVGLIGQGGVPVRISAFLALPTSVRLVAVDRGEVVGTISLVMDSAFGLPMQKTYPTELDALRSQGRRLAEAGALAIRKDHRNSGLNLLLSKAIWKMATLLNATDWVVGVRPNAEVIYRTLMCFESLGPLRHYSGLKDDVATVALRVDLLKAPDEFAKRFARVRRTFNPHTFFCATAHPQLQVPEDLTTWEASRPLHQQATLRLLALRPEVLTGLSEGEFNRFGESFGARRLAFT